WPDSSPTYGKNLVNGRPSLARCKGLRSISAHFTLMWAFPFPSLEVHFVLSPFLRKQLQNDFKIEEL
ncbi:hypothetical protein, partial [Amycolatopsis magusensis]